MWGGKKFAEKGGEKRGVTQRKPVWLDFLVRSRLYRWILKAAMTPKKQATKGMTMEAFAAEPEEPLEVLKARQEADAAWAERAFAGQEPLGPPIRLQCGRPKAWEEAPPTVVKAIRMPVQLLASLQAQAEAQGLSLNALLPLAASGYLIRHRVS